MTCLHHFEQLHKWHELCCLRPFDCCLYVTFNVLCLDSLNHLFCFCCNMMVILDLYYSRKLSFGITVLRGIYKICKRFYFARIL